MSRIEYFTITSEIRNKLPTELRRSVAADQSRTGFRPDFQHWPETGGPPVMGGEGEEEDMEWDLFEEDREQWFRKMNPEWSEEQIEQALDWILAIELVDMYEKMIKELEEIRKKYGEVGASDD